MTIIGLKKQTNISVCVCVCVVSHQLTLAHPSVNKPITGLTLAHPTMSKPIIGLEVVQACPCMHKIIQ